MLSWLKNRLHSEPPEARASAVSSGEIKPQATGKFRLEALEPRVLLSGDTPFAEVYRTLLSDEKDGANANTDAYIQQLDAETSAVIAAANGSDFGNSASPSSVNVAWSDGWQFGANTDTANTQDASETDDSDAVASTAETENGTEIALLEQAATPPASPENIEADDDSLSLVSSDQDVLLNDIPSAELPRGPPVNEQHSSVVIAAESIQINDLSLSYSSETDEGEAFDVEFLLISEVSEDGLPRAPPVVDALSYPALAPVLEEALRIWTTAGLSAELAGRLASIQVYITDLANGELGQAQQNTITLDTTAAGRGWFVDPTPGDHAEFSLTLSDFQMAAVAGSLAYGRIDLLTVLVHEIGHVLGFGHEAGLAVMAGNLGHSQRVLLDGDTIVSVAEIGEPISGAVTTLPTLNLSDSANNAATINIQVNADGTLTVSGALTDDNGTNIAGITNIIGNTTTSASITLTSQYFDNVWTLTGIDSGTLKAGGFIISFTNIKNLTGGSTADSFEFKSGGAVTGAIDDGAGTLTVGVADFVQVSGDYNFVRTSFSGAYSGSSNGTVTGANVLTVGGTTGTGLIGANAFDNPLGLQGTLSSFGLGVVTDGTHAWDLFQGTITNPSFVGFGGDFGAGLANITVTVNAKSVVGTYLKTSVTPISVATGGTPSSVSLSFSDAVIAATTTFSFTISDFVHLSGAFTFGVGLGTTVDVQTGLDASTGPPVLSGITGADGSDGTFGRSTDYTTLYNVPVSVFTIAASSVSVFVGYASGLNPTGPNAAILKTDVPDDAIGLYASSIDIGLALMSAKSTGQSGFDTQKLSFYSLKATASNVEILGIPELTLSAGNLEVRVNSGKPWTSAPLVTPTVDFSSSNYTIQTSGAPIVIDFEGNLIGASADRVLLRVSDFVYVSGGFSFNKGGVREMDVRTNLNSTQALPVLGTLMTTGASATDPGAGTLAATSDGSIIWNLPVQTIDMGLSNVDVFVGYTDGSANALATAATDGELTKAELEAANAIGLLLDEASLGMLIGSAMPVVGAGTLNTAFLKFFALQADASLIELLGVPGLNLAVNNLQVRVNQGSFVPGVWPVTPGLYPPPVIDFKLSFPDNAWDPSNPDGDALADGYRVQTDTSGSFKALLFEQSVVGASADRVLLRVSDFVYVSGGFSFNKGGVEHVDVKTNLSELQAAAVLGTLMGTNTGNTGNTLGASADGSMIYNLPIQTIEIGLSNVDVFVGYTDPASNVLATAAKTTGELTEANLLAAKAVGLFVDEANLGMVIGSAMPVSQLSLGTGTLNAAALKFFSLMADADLVALVGVPGVELSGRGIRVEVNSGSKFPIAPLAVIGPAVDWKMSYPDTDGNGTEDAVGYEVATGTTTDPVVLSMTGFIIGGGVENVHIELGEFVYIDGAIYFEMGTVKTVQLADSFLPIGDTLSQLGLASTLGTVMGAAEKDVVFLSIGGKDLQAFFGINGPYWVDADNDGVIDRDPGTQQIVDAETNDDAIGLVIDNLTFGLTLATPTNTLDPTRYIALKGSANMIGLVGLEDHLTMRAEQITVELNISTPLLAGFPLLPVIDWVDSFGLDGYGVKTGARNFDLTDITVNLKMEELLIKAGIGFMTMDVLGAVSLSGSIGVEIGPSASVTLADGTKKDVKTLTFGAANVYGFIGYNGPYVHDSNGNGYVDRGDFTTNGDGSLGAPTAVRDGLGGRPKAVGFAINDLDIGLMVMVATGLDDSGIYLAAKLDVNDFGMVGIDGFNATGRFDVNMNVGIGLSELDPSASPVDFGASFSEANALFALMNTTNTDNILDQAEQEAALASGYIGGNITTAAQLVSILNASNGPPDEYLTMLEVSAKLKNGFLNQAAIDALDADDNGRLNSGYEVFTGDPANPIVIDFDSFLINIQLGGAIKLDGVFRMYGVFLFSVDPTGLKAFVAAGLEIGSDIGASNGSKIFTMNALGALVINGAGIAADIEVSASIGGALQSVLSLNATARLVFNTTGATQTITIPERYAGFLTGADSIVGALPGSASFDPAQSSNLAGKLAGRFTTNSLDGSLTFTINGGAPRLGGGVDAPGSYFLVAIDGNLTIAQTFVIDADFQLKFSTQGLELGFNGTIDLGGFVTVDAEGGAVIESGVFAAYARLTIDIDVAGINIFGGADFEINTGTASKTVYDALSNPHVILGTTYMVSVDAEIDLFGILTATGDVKVGIVNGNFLIDVDATLSFFGIVDVSISGYFNTNGTFSFTGSLALDLTVGSGAGKFGIYGGLSVTLSNSGFSGHGEVGLVIFGERINVASATVTVNWSTGAWLIRAEGPLSVWLEVSTDGYGKFKIDGGLGFFDDVLEVLGDVAEAIADGVVAAANAVANALVDLGEAILEFGQDVVEFFKDVGDAIADAAEAVWDAISGYFEDSRTVITTNTINPKDYYVYSTSLVAGTLTITNGTNDGYAPQLTLWVVNGNVIVDAPDVTKNVVISTSQYQERDYTWDGWPPYGEWGSWYNVGAVKTQTANINVTNASNFALGSVSKIVIHGTNYSETIILDRNTVSINADVYANGGDDVIATGKGNDRVWGGNGDDVVFTYEGNDELYGENNNDKLFGGTGNDLLNGGAGDDLLDENKDRANPDVLITETNTLIGGSGKDTLLGSPGKDSLDGGSGDDILLGLSNEDTYVFENGYGTDQFVDYKALETLDFSGVTDALQGSMSNDGITFNAGAGNSLVIDQFATIKMVKLGSGSDHFDVTKLPGHHLDITDAGGADIYDFDFDFSDSAQAVASVNIQDNDGSIDRIELDVDSTGFDVHLHPLEVLLNNLELTFNVGIEQLALTDHAAVTTVTTAPDSGLTTLLLKSGVTITSALGGLIELLARDDFIMQAGAFITTTGNVVIRGDDDDVDSTGATIDLLGTINANGVAVYGGDDNDTVTIGNVTTGSETTISTYAGADTINIRTISAATIVNAGLGNDIVNVGSLAQATDGNLDGIGALLTVNGDGGSDTLNLDDTGDASANTGTLTSTTIIGLDMTGGGITYDAIAILNIDLGTQGDTFTIASTHAGVTNLNAHAGADIINIRTISGATTVNGGTGSETINIGSNAAGTLANPNINTGGIVDGIAALLTINGNDPTSGSDWLYVDDSGDSNANTGILTSTTITDLDMGGGITYGTIEHLVISLGTGGNTFTINSTHGAATSPYQEETIVSSGSGVDTVHINNVTDLLFVNGQGSGDTVNMNGTGGGSVSTLNGGAGNDVFNVKATNGAVNINGGDDNDTVNAGSTAPSIPTVPTILTGNIDAINALLTVNGGTGTDDVLNLDDSNPANTAKSAVLTGSTLRGLELESGIDYSNLDQLHIWLAAGNNVFTIDGTHTATTTVNTAQGQDVIDINGASGQLTVNAEDGNDIINVRAINGATTVNAGNGTDTINVGSIAAGTIGNPDNNSGGTVDAIGALLTINGNGAADVLNVDETGETDANTGILSATTITGLDMAVGITYGTLETLNIGLGSDTDTFTITSTHLGVTNLNSNAGGDIINIRTIAGVTTVNGGNDSDTINVGSNAAGTVDDANNNSGGTVDGIAALLNINGNDPDHGSDLLNVDDTGDTNGNTGFLTSTTITDLDMGDSITYGTIEHLKISLGSGDDIFTILSTHGIATLAAVELEETILNTGAGADTVRIDDVTDLLFVNGQAAGDTIHIYGTGTGSHSIINGDDGNDTVNVRAMNGSVDVNGGDDNDTINVGSIAPALPSLPTTLQGNLDAINALLDVNGGDGTSDTLNIDDSNPRNTAKFGTLTFSTVRGLELEDGFDYTELETINLWLGTGANIFTINSTHDGATTVNTAQGADTVHVNGVSGQLTLNLEEDNDTVNVRATGLGSTVWIKGHGGDDTVNLSDVSPALPAFYQPFMVLQIAERVGSIDGIDGLIDIDGGFGADDLNIDDSRNIADKAGTLTSNTLRGLSLPAGVDYEGLEDMNLWLGTGTDGLYIDSTHTGTTDVFMGDGNATVNQRDDTVAIKSINGVTTIHGQAGNDSFYVNVEITAANDANFFAAFASAADAANDAMFDALFTRTHANGLNGLNDTLNLHGDGNSDLYTVNLAGQGQALVNVLDNGAPDNGVDTLIINGADEVSGLGNQPDDTFLLRRNFVALLNDSADVNSDLDQVERVNYDENINARLIVNGLGGNDAFAADDNSSITTLDGGAGDDTFQIGQVFGTARDDAANLAAGDTFDTTPVIIGVIRDSVGALIFNPAEQALTATVIERIEQAIKDAGNQPLDGIAYVSDGVSHATTVYGGDGADTFGVYHNKGALRLEGEDGNDEFVVRAFVILRGQAQAETEVFGGGGEDSIQYAINAPVSIDGGAGFDSVVVLGTPFGDNFVVTAYGIFGAGLNVRFTNVESAELDALEGNDTIYVVSTSEKLVTTVIGGLGSDTINIMGDVTERIVSNDLLGRSGVISHNVLSGDSDYVSAGVNGVSTFVLSSRNGALVDISPFGDQLRVSEDGVTASYFIMLTGPLAEDFSTVYLTVSAGVASNRDRDAGGASLLVSTDGITFTNAVVLTFNAASAKQQIYIKAIDDSSLEGERIAMISHSINSASESYNDLPILDMEVVIVDNDKPGIDIVQVGSGGVADGLTEVLEGSFGFGDTYRIRLTTAPAAGETVEITLLHDGQLQLSKTVFTFTLGGPTAWNLYQDVTITANDEAVADGTKLSSIIHVMTSSVTDSAFNLAASDAPVLDVTVYDNETAGVIVRETGGSTVTVEGGEGDSYSIRLTRMPVSPLTLSLNTDTQTKLFSSDATRFSILDESTAAELFKYTLTFDDQNWDDWFEVQVDANSGYAGGSSPTKIFATSNQNLDQIRGPLIVEGGVVPGKDRSLVAAVVLPGESNQASGQEDPLTDESRHIDRLNIFHTDNVDADFGLLTHRGIETGIFNTGNALTGLGMGGNLPVNEGTPTVPVWVDYGGGITYAGFEIFELLLGKGDENLTVSDTADGAITLLHGGGGSDSITVSGRGQGPLVIYGDTSQDGLRYSNTTGAASVHGTRFTNPGDDILDASALAALNDGFAGVVVYGGVGADTITGSQDFDHLAGGSGADVINGQAGDDHIYGDGHFNVDPVLFARDQISRFNASIPAELEQINRIFAVLTSTDAYGDELHGNDNNDIILGDHGVISQANGIRRLETAGSVVRIETTVENAGDIDTITGGADHDVILGGHMGDLIDGNAGHDIIIGDHGFVDYVTRDSTLGDIDVISSTSTTSYGGVDQITGGEGDDIIIGGRFADLLSASGGNNIVFGDSGIITSAAADNARRGAAITLISLGRIETTAYGDGGADDITTGGGMDIILGGISGNAANGDTGLPDVIRSGAGADIVLGDNGELVYDSDATGNPATLDLVTTTQPLIGGVDHIYGGGGNDFIFGGTGSDLIYGDRLAAGTPDLVDAIVDSDLIFGDHGELRGVVNSAHIGIANASFVYTSINTGAADGGAADVIYAGSGAVPPLTDFGRNIILGQQGADTIYGGSGDDDIIGGHNVADGSDTGDFIDGGPGNDVIAGDNARIIRTGAPAGPRFGVLTGSQIYTADGLAMVSPTVIGTNPALVKARLVELFDHDNSANNVGNFGDDRIAGGADDDEIFGLLGNDIIHGDGRLVDGSGGLVLATLLTTETGSDLGGDDYIEGNGGNDLIFGGLGQDDIVGGSSSLYNLTASNMRPDGADTIFGGNGEMIARNTEGDGSHARDSDMILGDNGNIFRIVGINGVASGAPTFNYDNYDGIKIVVRAAQLLDYTPGGPDYTEDTDDDLTGIALNDIGAADVIHGESGDDFIYGMVGDDILFGDAQDDDIIGGYGHDWISGGTGQDGVLGDDGRLFTSRNGTPEPLYGIGSLAGQLDIAISTPGNVQQAVINVSGALKKTADMTPFNPVIGGYELSDPKFADDIIYGGWGDDFLHGGAGDDAISGAEALPEYFANPYNPGNVLRYSPVTGEFAEYNEFQPLVRIVYQGSPYYADGAQFILNFDHTEGAVAGSVRSDGNDAIFGDLGNDWLVGGTGRDNLYGGWGDDLLNADDDLSTNGGLNNVPDTNASYEDRAFGGAGRDRLIANTGGDRLIDWAGEFNSYLVPFAPFGLGTVSRALQPQIPEFLYALSRSDGADPTRSSDARNGEPFGELGLVRQQDFAWRDQTGAPDDPQPGNIPGGARDVLRSASFDSGSLSGLFADSGVWQSTGGVLQVGAQSLGGDAVAVYHVGDQLPGYFEVLASVSAMKPTSGWKANSYIIFDYQSETDFKFAGLDVSISKLVMGHRDASGWHIDEQAAIKGGVKAGVTYNLLLAVNGVNATLVLDNKDVFSHTYQPRVVEGYAYGLNWGMVGVGSNNARGSFDNIRIQVLPPQVTLDATDDFTGPPELSFSGASNAVWSMNGGRYGVTAGEIATTSMIDLGPAHLNFNSYLEMSTVVQTQDRAGFIFERYGEESFKFVIIDAKNQKLVIGHYTLKSGWVEDAVVKTTITAGQDYTLGVSLKGSSVSATLSVAGKISSQAIAGYVFNASTVDGKFGLMAIGGNAIFDDVRVKTNDKAFVISFSGNLMAAAPSETTSNTTLTGSELDSIVAVAMSQWIEVLAVNDVRLAALGNLRFLIVDLEGSLLGQTEGKTILIDKDAAGYGWYTGASVGPSSGNTIDGHMDLLTVVMHEIGHALGFDHDDSTTDALMDETLEAGVRLAIRDIETDITWEVDQASVFPTGLIKRAADQNAAMLKWIWYQFDLDLFPVIGKFQHARRV